ncbi:MAG: hypothetical protein KJ818_05555, partial [Candidatus Omnitrophica bacterium]|nr:hypothetical protein [Candidatus Omnitrophota bacterium]
IKVFPNIRGILFKDIDYNQLVAETIGKIAEAYESANFSQFSQYISKDYLGNKTFLEEGIRTDFDLFSNIRLTLYINRIDKRGNIFAAETRWDKTQTPRSTGQEQRTSGNTTFMFVFEDGLMKIQNLRGNLIYATLQPEIAQASGLPQTVVNQIREANQERNPVQPGAGETEQAGGTSTQATIPVKNGSIHSQYATAGDCTSFRTDFDYDFSSGTEGSAGGGDFYLEWNILFNLGGAQIQQITSSTFEALNEAPTSGYTNSSAGTLAAGEVYAFITQEGYYGKFKVTSKNTVDCNRNTVNFSYAVQTDGTRNLKTQ